MAKKHLKINKDERFELRVTRKFKHILNKEAQNRNMSKAEILNTALSNYVLSYSFIFHLYSEIEQDAIRNRFKE